MHTEDFHPITAGLRDLGGRRVWSLMISLFGDLAREKDQCIDGPLLSAMMSLMQVRPEAARVALHRLRNDGWVQSEKSGRISQHSLTRKGRQESAAASPQIYAAPDLTPQDWQLAVTKDASPDISAQMEEMGFVPLMPRAFVGPADVVAPQDTLCLPGSHAPDWVRQGIEPEAQRDAYLALTGILDQLQQDLPDPATLSPLQIAVLRCLIVHNWRRLVLKQLRPPACLIDPEGPSHQCHLRVHALLTRLHRPDLSEIAQFHAAA